MARQTNRHGTTSRLTVPVKDRPTVTPDGEPLSERIDGLTVRWLTPLEDLRGEVVEVYSDAWGVHPEPVVHVCQISLRPGRIKGWVVHRLHDDRIYHCRGSVRWAFYDDRPDSSTHQMLNLLTLSERRRALVVIPKGVYHAVQNLEATEAVFLDMPTRPYDHADPDKYRLPLKNDLIPFSFDDGPGW